jgi:hypothetical protein
MIDQNIAQFVIETVRQNPGIMGCRLGKIVKERFPGFSGLRGFIARSCASEVVIVASKGEDYSYDLGARVKGISPSFTPTRDTAVAPSRSFPPLFSTVNPTSSSASSLVKSSDFKPTFWQSFTNPNSDVQLVINKTTCEMIVGPFPKIEPPLEEIKKATRDEHGKIMKGFLDLLDPVDRQYVQQTVGPDPSWTRWSNFMWNFGAGKYSSLWLNYRTSMLRKIFEDRLVAMGLDSAVIPVLVAKLMDSKNQSRTSGQPDKANPATNIKAPADLPKQSLTEDYMRKLAGIVVSHMDIDELRSLRLPLGAVVDALEKNAPRT